MNGHPEDSGHREPDQPEGQAPEPVPVEASDKRSVSDVNKRIEEVLADALERDLRAEERDTAARQRDEAAEKAEQEGQPINPRDDRRDAAIDRLLSGEDRDSAAGHLHDVLPDRPDPNP